MMNTEAEFGQFVRQVVSVVDHRDTPDRIKSKKQLKHAPYLFEVER